MYNGKWRIVYVVCVCGVRTKILLNSVENGKTDKNTMAKTKGKIYKQWHKTLRIKLKIEKQELT